MSDDMHLMVYIMIGFILLIIVIMVGIPMYMDAKCKNELSEAFDRHKEKTSKNEF